MTGNLFEAIRLPTSEIGHDFTIRLVQQTTIYSRQTTRQSISDVHKMLQESVDKNDSNIDRNMLLLQCIKKVKQKTLHVTICPFNGIWADKHQMISISV